MLTHNIVEWNDLQLLEMHEPLIVERYPRENIEVSLDPEVDAKEYAQSSSRTSINPIEKER